MARKKKEMGSGGNWMDTYGDMVTLLFTFFVCLYSMASMSEEKWYELRKAFNPKETVEVDEVILVVTEQEGHAVHSNIAAAGGVASETDPTGDQPSEDVIFSELFNKLLEYVEQIEFGEMIKIEQSKSDNSNEKTDDNPDKEKVAKPIYMQVNSTILFQPDKAILLPDSLGPLGGIADLIIEFQDDIGQVVIKGYTADIESHADAVHLSNERALTVLDFLRKEKGFTEEKLASTGLGKNFPIADNSTEEGRAKNRRVEIVIIPKSIASSNFLTGSYFSPSTKSLTDIDE